MSEKLVKNQSIYKIFYSVRNEKTQKLAKLAAAKSILSSVYVIDVNCFDECSSFHVMTRSHCFYKFYYNSEVFSTVILLLSLE